MLAYLCTNQLTLSFVGQVKLTPMFLYDREHFKKPKLFKCKYTKNILYKKDTPHPPKLKHVKN